MTPRIILTGLGVLCAMGLTSACGDTEPKAGLEGPTVAIAVAPLTLPDVDGVCYGLSVYNGNPDDAGTDTVWTQTGVCSGQYGNGAGGGITYVGPCDASIEGNRNYIGLVLESIDAGGALTDQVTVGDGGVADFVNPCTAGAACTLDFECVENADTLIEFNVTVLRAANQGFFDIAVNFDDIFCSAKMDCEYDNGPIMLLLNPETGERGQTGVVALACTSGAGDASDTVLHMSSIEVTCDGGDPIVLDPTVGPGNAWRTTTPGTPDPDTNDAVWQYAVYRGVEDLVCGAGGSCNKMYWNVAIGFDPNAANCSVTARGTASTSAQMNDALTPENSTYPWIDFAVTLTGDGELLCGQNPLNGENSGVQTTYTPVADRKLFCHRFDGTTVSTSDTEGCGSAVSGHIFEDTNGNGGQDAGEPDLPDIDVVITDSLGGTQTVTTDAGGDYSATVPPGDTTLDVVEATLPAGATQTAGTDPTTVAVPAGGSVNDVDGYQPATDSNDCIPNPCLDGGTCTDTEAAGDGDFSCACVDEFTGEACEVDCSETVDFVGDLYVHTAADVAYLETLDRISGDIIVANDTEVVHIRMYCLREYSGEFKVQSSEHLETLWMQRGPGTAGPIAIGFVIENNTAFTSYDVSAMSPASGAALIRNNCVLSDVQTATGLVNTLNNNNVGAPDTCYAPGDCRECSPTTSGACKLDGGTQCRDYQGTLGGEANEEASCPADFSPCVAPYCGDGFCDPGDGEDEGNCAADCSICSCAPNNTGPCQLNGTCYAVQPNGMCAVGLETCIVPPPPTCQCSAGVGCTVGVDCTCFNGPGTVCYPYASPGVCPTFAAVECVP
ncbi:MAG: hypothetical protein ACI9MR_001338 [Myxococcota bacterium]|jgi:hypothetical protein